MRIFEQTWQPFSHRHNLSHLIESVVEILGTARNGGSRRLTHLFDGSQNVIVLDTLLGKLVTSKESILLTKSKNKTFGRNKGIL